MKTRGGEKARVSRRKQVREVQPQTLQTSPLDSDPEGGGGRERGGERRVTHNSSGFSARPCLPGYLYVNIFENIVKVHFATIY